MKENTLLTIYGARKSKNGKYINLTLISGEGQDKQFYTACVKFDNSKRVSGRIEDDAAVIFVPLLTDNKKATEEMDEDTPF